jgi:hypothetical protein
MRVCFFDGQDQANPLNGVEIDNAAELSEVLEGLYLREPFFCELVGGNGFTLLIGVAPDSGCVQHSPSNGDTPHLMAVGTDQGGRSSFKEFLMGNTPTPVPVRYLLPWERAASIALYFMRTGQRDPNVHWEEI